jgi:hypothetical protein
MGEWRYILSDPERKIVKSEELEQKIMTKEDEKDKILRPTKSRRIKRRTRIKKKKS